MNNFPAQSAIEACHALQVSHQNPPGTISRPLSDCFDLIGNPASVFKGRFYRLTARRIDAKV